MYMAVLEDILLKFQNNQIIFKCNSSLSVAVNSLCGHAMNWFLVSIAVLEYFYLWSWKKKVSTSKKNPRSDLKNFQRRKYNLSWQKFRLWIFWLIVLFVIISPFISILVFVGRTYELLAIYIILCQWVSMQE